MSRQSIENRPNRGLTLFPCPFSVLGLPNLDGFDMLSSVVLEGRGW
ncbi:hypothetical protein [Spirulina major]|nr:hypothetical protein [Spirulina major]